MRLKITRNSCPAMVSSLARCEHMELSDMGVHIRLQRKGSTHSPFYHVVATDQRNPRDGRFIEKLGYYDPKGEPSTIELKEDRLQHWYKLGAQLTDAAKKLVKIKKIPLSRAQTTNK